MTLAHVVFFGDFHTSAGLESGKATPKCVEADFFPEGAEHKQSHQNQIPTARRPVHFVPLVPVYGFTFGRALQLSALDAFGDVRTCGARYTPAFVTVPRTRTAFEATAGADSKRASRRSARMGSKHSTPTFAQPDNARSGEAR